MAQPGYAYGDGLGYFRVGTVMSHDWNFNNARRAPRDELNVIQSVRPACSSTARTTTTRWMQATWAAAN
jgi:hypothetical protein